MKIINIQNKDTVVDDDVFVWASKIKWVISKLGYVSYRKKDKRYFLHRMIMNTPETFHTDHINGNKLDNLKSNLRICSTKENVRNSGIRLDNKTGYKGVSFRKDRKTYTAEICKDGKRFRLGCYRTAKEAALAYNTSAKELFGDYARLNSVI